MTAAVAEETSPGDREAVRLGARPGAPAVPAPPDGDGVMTNEPREPRNTPVDLFGSNSDGGMRMSAWLEVMCLGCRRESVKARNEGDGGGFGCELPARAICDPYDAEMPEWVVTEAEVIPGRGRKELADALGDGPWPVCTSYEPRTKRSDAGKRRGPKVTGMEPLFEIEVA